ncbi:globin [Parasteatoda tepidariorum]|uniref:globin n=1 Tax=Parasteatoda tepidariorum TaxID=114398 RepID=UPI001C720555|nr:globin-like [Parasteatoda tepidariorum]
MGFIFSKLWTPANYDDPDPATGLTPRQRDTVQNTWKIVRSNIKENGLTFFVKFFHKYPEYQKLFPFADVPLEKLRDDKKVLAHAMAVMYALNSIVDSLGDVDCLVQILVRIGSGHKPRSIQPIHFENLASFLVSFLIEALGKSVMDDSAVEAWRTAFKAANGIIINALQNA